MHRRFVRTALLVCIALLWMVPSSPFLAQDQSSEFIIDPGQYFAQNQITYTPLTAYTGKGAFSNNDLTPYGSSDQQLQLTLTSASGQKLNFAVIGDDPQAILDYANKAQVFVEALPTTQPMFFGDSLPLQDIFLGAVHDLAGLSREDVLAAQASGQITTLQRLLESKGATVDTEEVYGRMQQWGADAVSNSRMTQAMVDAALNQGAELINDAFSDENLTLFQTAPDAAHFPDTDPVDDAQLAVSLNKGDLIVQLELVPDQSAPRYIVYYSVDPSVITNQTINYRAKQATSAWAQAVASTGCVQGVMWRTSPSGYSRSGNDCAGGAAAPTLSNNNGATATYDARVTGLTVNGQSTTSSYTMYGGWTVG